MKKMITIQLLVMGMTFSMCCGAQQARIKEEMRQSQVHDAAQETEKAQALAVHMLEAKANTSFLQKVQDVLVPKSVVQWQANKKVEAISNKLDTQKRTLESNQAMLGVVKGDAGKKSFGDSTEPMKKLIVDTTKKLQQAEAEKLLRTVINDNDLYNKYLKGSGEGSEYAKTIAAKGLSEHEAAAVALLFERKKIKSEIEIWEKKANPRDPTILAAVQDKDLYDAYKNMASDRQNTKLYDSYIDTFSKLMKEKGIASNQYSEVARGLSARFNLDKAALQPELGQRISKTQQVKEQLGSASKSVGFGKVLDVVVPSRRDVKREAKALLATEEEEALQAKNVERSQPVLQAQQGEEPVAKKSEAAAVWNLDMIMSKEEQEELNQEIARDAALKKQAEAGLSSEELAAKRQEEQRKIAQEVEKARAVQQERRKAAQEEAARKEEQKRIEEEKQQKIRAAEKERKEREDKEVDELMAELGYK